MSRYQYKAEQLLSIGIEEAWSFFSSPKNLATITPLELNFKILSNLDNEEIYEGMKIDYFVSPLFNIPLHWQTEIVKVDKEKSFTDKQVKGPYKVWEHTHKFTIVNNGVLMQDIVNYELPFLFIGNIAHKLLIRKKIENIFLFRKSFLENKFNKNGRVLI